MKIIVTGGAGFIGSAVIRHIIGETDHQLLNIDCLTYASNLKNLSEIENSDRYSFKKVDIRDSSLVSSLFLDYEPDLLMHLAAESHVDRSIAGPSTFIQTNILGTYNLLEASRNYCENSKRGYESFLFHHISTDEVYGDLPHPDIHQHATKELFSESSPYAPSSPYSASKAASDHLVRSWSRTYGLKSLVTNCSNNYGPYQLPDKLIPLCIKKIFTCEGIPVYGSGQQIRDWLYVEDHASALYKLASSGVSGETFNIGGKNELKNIDVVKMICNIMQELLPPSESKYVKDSKKYKDIKNYEELITFVEDRPGHDLRYAIDSSKLAKRFRWKPKETFESGLRKTIYWYLEKLSNDISYFDKA